VGDRVSDLGSPTLSPRVCRKRASHFSTPTGNHTTVLQPP